MPGVVGLAWDLIAKDNASPAFLRAAAAMDKTAAAGARATRGVASVAHMSAVGAKMTKALTVPLLGIAAVGVDQAAKWQKAMTLVQTAGGETATKTAVLSKGLLQLSKSTGTSLDQLGEGIYTIAKAGAQKWSAIDQLKVMKAAAQGAKAENVDLGTATDALSTVMLDYHVNASKAVATENQLIRASGLAKTNFADFSKSLSNVMPIAAALGVKQNQVLGSLATMTQHGVSPQQATENMRNLLFNLAGQNNVASQAMQQLGINTVDLAKNLGRRGLTGTLAIVDAALRAHTKDGMVVVDVHKAAALATRSLDTELGTFSGKLSSQSKGLLDGKTGIAEYQKYAKSLGGTAGASALQFLALYKNSQGFSDQLRSGKSTITTTTGQYQKLLGGMTGASVAMQIAGKYAKDNARNVAAVGQAALAAGSDVLGWNKTQDTLAVKLDKAKASLQVMAVEIGTALIPAVSKIVGWVSKAVDWFGHLSGTQKTVLTWSAGILAAMGPVLAIGGRLMLVAGSIGRFAGNVGAMLARVSGASMTTSVRVSSAMRGIGAAFGGAVIGAGVATLTQHMSTASQNIGTLASTALGAAQGFAMGGPIGAAIGAGAGLLGNLATRFLGAGDAAKKAVAPTDEFTNAILKDSLALGANVRALTAHDLNSGGSGSSFNVARRLGIDPKTLTDAVLGLKGAKDQVNAILNANTGKRLGINPGTGVPSFPITQPAKTLLGLPADATRLNNDQIKTLLQRAQASKTLAGVLGVETGKLKANLAAAKDYAAATSTAGKNDSARVRALKVINAEQAAATSSLNGLTEQVAIHGTSLNKSSADGRSNISVLTGQIQKYQAIEVAQTLAGASAADAGKGFDANAAALARQAARLGVSGVAVDALVGKMRLTPKQVITDMLVNIGKATASTTQLQSMINAIQQHKVPGLSADSGQGLAVVAALQDRIDALRGGTVTVNADTAAAQQAIDRLRASLAAMGASNQAISKAVELRGIRQAVGTQAAFGQSTIPPNTAFTVGEAGWEGGVSDSHGRVSIFSNAQSKAIGFRSPTGYATGTTRASDLQSVVSAIGALLASGHSSQSTAADLRSAISSLALAAGKLRVSLAYGVALQTAAARRDSIRAALGTPNTTPTTAYDRLASAHSAYSDSFSSTKAATQAFDVTTAGVSAQVYSDQAAPPVTAGSILADLTKQASAARDYAYLLRRLSAEGMSGWIVRQLAAAGPAAMAQAKALAAATPAQIAQFGAQSAALNNAGTAAGTTVANAYYLAGVNSAQGIVNGLLSQQRAVNAAIYRLSDGMVAALKRRLGIRSPSTVMRWHGAMAGEGFRLALENKVHGIQQAATKLGAAAIPKLGSAAIPTGGSSSPAAAPEVHEHHYHYHIEGTGWDENALANALKRRESVSLAMLT